MKFIKTKQDEIDEKNLNKRELSFCCRALKVSSERTIYRIMERLGLSIANHMRSELCVDTLKSAVLRHPELRGALAHSDRGSQYTSAEYRKAIAEFGVIQSMNSAAGRCHDNAKCESVWARFKSELIYGRYDTTKMTFDEVKTLIWRYFMSYWNNRRVCSANGGLPPSVMRERFFAQQRLAQRHA